MVGEASKGCKVMLSAELKYWIECIDSYNLIEKSYGRHILIWGAYSKAGLLCDELERKDVKIAGYIDGHRNISEYRGKAVYKPNSISLEKDYYILIAVEGVRKEIQDHLKRNNLRKDEDYFYFSEHSPNIVISKLMGEYRDIYGNRFCYEGTGDADVKIHCIGGGNTVIIGDNFEGDGLDINTSYGGTIKLGDNFVSHGDCLLDVSMSGIISIGKGVSIMKDSQIRAKYEGNVCIGDYLSGGERLHITSGRFSKVTVGDDCMFSHDVSILGTNSHSIIDLDRKENRASVKEKPVEIGNHVWLGKGSTVLYGTRINEGSVVGTQSLLKGDYPSNSVIVGNVAKVIRNNCTWDRRREIDFEEL